LIDGRENREEREGVRSRMKVWCFVWVMKKAWVGDSGVLRSRGMNSGLIVVVGDMV